VFRGRFPNSLIWGRAPNSSVGKRLLHSMLHGREFGARPQIREFGKRPRIERRRTGPVPATPRAPRDRHVYNVADIRSGPPRTGRARQPGADNQGAYPLGERGSPRRVMWAGQLPVNELSGAVIPRSSGVFLDGRRHDGPIDPPAVRIPETSETTATDSGGGSAWPRRHSSPASR